MSFTPWTTGPRTDGSWISEEDRRRIDRANARVAADDPHRVHYTTEAGVPLIPGQWTGNPWGAKVVLLLLNPAYSTQLDDVYNDAEMVKAMSAQASGQWDARYPNPWLTPKGRRADSWCSSVAFAALHKKLVELGGEVEESWMQLSKTTAMLELSPWASFRWSEAAYVSTTHLSVKLAYEAMNDPSRIVLLGRGEADWKAAGLLDADLLPKSLGVRAHQSRISQANFPTVWNKIIDAVQSL
jgi:hypothetical protein